MAKSISPLSTFRLALPLTLVSVAACGGTDDQPGPNQNDSTGAVASVSAGGSGSVAAGAGGTPAGTGGGVANTSGAPTGTGGTPAGTGGEPGNACEAGSAAEGRGPDACPDRGWTCVDETVGNPAVRVVGAECSEGHTGGCCSLSDKCLTQTDGASGSRSTVEVTLDTCQIGCIANPSAQACVDCINTQLGIAGLPALSAGCGTCWAGLVGCSFMNCLAPCATGAASTACRECAFDKCVVGSGKFNECSGLLSRGGL